MFQNTPYTSPEWLLAIYIPPISVARLPFLHGRSCISGLDTVFRMALLPAGKRDFFGALICLSRWLGWPKRAYVFFPEYIQEKTHKPFLAKGIIVQVLPLFMCFQGDSNLPPEICFLVLIISILYKSKWWWHGEFSSTMYIGQFYNHESFLTFPYYHLFPISL